MWGANASGENGSGLSEMVIAGLRRGKALVSVEKVSPPRCSGKRIISAAAIEIADVTRTHRRLATGRHVTARRGNVRSATRRYIGQIRLSNYRAGRWAALCLASGSRVARF